MRLCDPPSLPGLSTSILRYAACMCGAHSDSCIGTSPRYSSTRRRRSWHSGVKQLSCICYTCVCAHTATGHAHGRSSGATAWLRPYTRHAVQRIVCRCTRVVRSKAVRRSRRGTFPVTVLCSVIACFAIVTGHNLLGREVI